MRLMDIAKNIDKSERNESYVDLEQLQQELNLPIYGYAEQNRLKAYWVEKWLCTDTWVGGRMYFFDDEPVAYSYQQGRKFDEQFGWFSQEAAEKVRDFVQELHKEELNVNICDVNEDIGDSYKIEFSAEVLDWNMARLNGKPIEFIERVRKPNDYGIDTDVRIRVPDTGEEMIVNVRDLDFLFHVNDGQVKSVGDLEEGTAASVPTEEPLVDMGDFEYEDGYLHFRVTADGYSLEGLYRIYDPENGQDMTLVSIDYGYLHPIIDRQWNRIEEALYDTCLNRYHDILDKSEAFKEKVVRAMEAAGYSYDALESHEGWETFYGEGGVRIGFDRLFEAAEWLDGVVFDDPEVSCTVEKILHPERSEALDVVDDVLADAAGRSAVLGSGDKQVEIEKE